MSQFVECKGLDAILRASLPLPLPLPHPLSLPLSALPASGSGGTSGGRGISGVRGAAIVSGSGSGVRMSRVYAEQEMVVCLLQVKAPPPPPFI